MDFEFKNVDDIDEKEIIRLLDKNKQTAQKINSEIKRLESAQDIDITMNSNRIVSILEENQEEISKRKKEVFEEEIDFYLSELSEVKDLDTDFKSALPVKKKQNYEKIVRRLILESYKNIKDINDFILELDSEISKEDLTSLKEEILLENKKIRLMQDYLIKDEKDIIEEDNEDNNLIFVETTYGNIRALEELKRIDNEHYSNFKELLQSIKDGTFKDVKRFKNNDALDGLFEVRLPYARIVFKRLNKNTYAIITAFVKKTRNSKSYRESLIKRVLDYKNIEEDIKKKIEDNNYILKNKNIEAEIFEMLTIDKKRKVLCQIKK